MNDSELQVFQSKLLELKEKLTARVSRLENDKERKSGALDADSKERALQLTNDEVVDALDEIERKELAQIDSALTRIQNKSYGNCSSCENEISQKRLQAVPFATQCLDCVETV